MHKKLLQFYLDEKTVKVYNGRADTWFLTKGFMDEYWLFFYMKNDERRTVTHKAKTEAEKILNSPLFKAMKEE